MSKNEIMPSGKKNELVIPDASPLIYLAKMNLLDLLPAMYERILITDVVWMEATRDPDKFEDASRILDWGEKLQSSMPNCFIIADTSLGVGIKEQMKKNSAYRERNAGENSIIQWASNASEDPIFREMHPNILYENGKVPKLVKLYDLPVTTLNTVALLQDALEAGRLAEILAKSAERQIYFNLEPSVQHNKAAQAEISLSKEAQWEQRPKTWTKNHEALEKKAHFEGIKALNTQEKHDLKVNREAHDRRSPPSKENDLER